MTSGTPSAHTLAPRASAHRLAPPTRTTGYGHPAAATAHPVTDHRPPSRHRPVTGHRPPPTGRHPP
ncbi:hypothetical protein PV366_47765, partial [Streptomyces ipomoeae]|nr:hypothetical protein [Streptomyces ipomoeae]